MSDTEKKMDGEHSGIEPAVFDELDNGTCISVEEIRDGIHGLKRIKSCNQDYNKLFLMNCL